MVWMRGAVLRLPCHLAKGRKKVTWQIAMGKDSYRVGGARGGADQFKVRLASRVELSLCLTLTLRPLHACVAQWDDVKDEPHTAHTLAQVPIMYADYRERDSDGSSSEPKLRDGVLADIAPTMLELLGVEQPASMTGKSLLKPSEAL